MMKRITRSMTKASSKLKETLVRDTKKVKVKKEIKDAAENLIQDQAEVKETLARDTKKVKVKKEIKDAAEKLIQDQAEVKEIQVVKKRIVKAKPVPASYLPETDLEHLKLMETLPKKPSKDFVFEYLTKVDKNLGKIIKSSDLDCFIFNLESKFKSVEDAPNTFGYLGRNIIFQQLSGKAASTIESRFLNLYKVEAEETYFPTPEQVLATDNEALRGVGLSMAKALYIKDLALHYQNGSLSDIKLKEADDKTVYELLIQVKGIGPWTIDMFLMSYLKRLDVLPLGDLGIKKGMIKHFELTVSDKKKLIDEKDMIELSKAWRPYRSVASWLMWEIANTITAT